MTARLLPFACLVVAACLSSGCSKPNSIEIFLKDAAGLRGGEKVFVKGVSIGVANPPRLLNGAAVILVRLNETNPVDIPKCTVFTVEPEQNSEHAWVLSGGDPGTESGRETCLDHGYIGVRHEGLDILRQGAAYWKALVETLRPLIGDGKTGDGK